jgi:hypothetical protein
MPKKINIELFNHSLSLNDLANEHKIIVNQWPSINYLENEQQIFI